MDFGITSLILDGSNGTKTYAGLSTEEAPSLIISNDYKKLDDGISFERIDSSPYGEIFTMYNDGLVYNWDALEEQWKFIYEKHYKLESKEMPLILTENHWNSKKNQVETCQLAFEKFEVPVFSMLNSQSCTSYGTGRATSLIIDLNDAFISVTPIVNGSIMTKGAIHNKFGGDFLNLHTLRYLQRKSGDEIDIEEQIASQGGNTTTLSSVKAYRVNRFLKQFRRNIGSMSQYILPPVVEGLSSDYHLTAKDYLINGFVVKDINPLDQCQMVEPLMQPFSYTNAFHPDISLSQENTYGLSELVLNSLKKLETTQNVYQALLKGIVITGENSFIPGLEQRLINDLVKILSNYTIETYSNVNLDERNLATWNGALILSSMNSGNFDNIFISKKEYEEFGENAVLEKFK
ncbi:hypothetical protein LJB42_002332 [Komagataella kurtzmanii]|nr:hypothetical protein LJB42_002332 [Komagataella kurtzmanii]